MDKRIICKNDRCFEVVPPSKNLGRPREFHNELCRKRYNARLHYQRQTDGASFTGLRTVTDLGYPKVTRIMSKTATDAERRLKEHGENCTGPGQYCQAKLRDAYNRKKLCLVRAVFTEDWLQVLYAEENKPYTREMTTEDGMWKDDYQEVLAKLGTSQDPRKQREDEELAAFVAAGGQVG